jgi:hypothetical protein
MDHLNGIIRRVGEAGDEVNQTLTELRYLQLLGLCVFGCPAQGGDVLVELSGDRMDASAWSRTRIVVQYFLVLLGLGGALIRRAQAAMDDEEGAQRRTGHARPRLASCGQGRDEIKRES